MRRWFAILAATVVITLGGVTLGVAQDGTPEATNEQGTPCASPSALVQASPGAAMVASPEIELEGTPAGEPGASPGAGTEETQIADQTCPTGAATPTT